MIWKETESEIFESVKQTLTWREKGIFGIHFSPGRCTVLTPGLRQKTVTVL